MHGDIAIKEELLGFYLTFLGSEKPEVVHSLLGSYDQLVRYCNPINTKMIRKFKEESKKRFLQMEKKLRRHWRF